MFDYRFIGPDGPPTLKQKQAHFAGGGKSYIVTCTSKADTSADSAQTFEDILATFKIPAPITQGFGMTSVVRGAVIGALVGGAVALFKMLAGPKKNKKR